MNYQAETGLHFGVQAAAFPVLGQAQKWKLQPFPVLGLPKSGNCRCMSSFWATSTFGPAHSESTARLPRI